MAFDSSTSLSSDKALGELNSSPSSFWDTYGGKVQKAAPELIRALQGDFSVTDSKSEINRDSLLDGASLALAGAAAFGPAGAVVGFAIGAISGKSKRKKAIQRQLRAERKGYKEFKKRTTSILDRLSSYKQEKLLQELSGTIQQEEEAAASRISKSQGVFSKTSFAKAQAVNASMKSVLNRANEDISNKLDLLAQVNALLDDEIADSDVGFQRKDQIDAILRKVEA